MISSAEKYLTFLVEKEEYGIQIIKVKEIIGVMEYTHIPKTPDFLKGVINLRGKIIPIIDFRLKFGFNEKPYDKITCIIVVDIDKGGFKKQLGIIVDTVSEVISISKNEIEGPDEYGVEIDEGYFLGIGKLKSKVVMLLDIEKVVSIEDITIIPQTKESAENA